jgi:hypothetical protein
VILPFKESQGAEVVVVEVEWGFVLEWKLAVE